MKFVKWFIILSVGMFLLMGCSDDDTTGPDTTGAILVINEFLASNDFGAVDENGDHEDWIEIYNAGDEAIDIGGMYVTDNLEELMTSEIPTTDPTLTTIEPGGYLVLWADKEPEQGILHLDDVKLSGDGEQIGLTDVDGTTILDSLTYGEQTTDISYGRTNDGADTWGYFGAGYATMPTLGAANGTGDVPEAILFINEFMSHNDTAYAGEFDEYPDWIELYNAGNIAIDIGGWSLTDDLTNLTQSVIPTTDPEATTVPPGGYLVLDCDDQENPGILHLAFKLGDDEDFALVDPDGVIVDQHNTTVIPDDMSEGRIPDGSDSWTTFDVPTPGTSNQ